GRSGGKRRARNRSRSAGRWIVGIARNTISHLSADIEIVAGGIKEGEQRSCGQAERRLRRRHQLSGCRSDRKTPDGGSRPRSRRINKLAAGVDGDRAGADAGRGSKRRAQYRSQCAGDAVSTGSNRERGNVADGSRVRWRVAGRRIRHIEELFTAIHRQPEGSPSSSRQRRERRIGQLRERERAVRDRDPESSNHPDARIRHINEIPRRRDENLSWTRIGGKGRSRDLRQSAAVGVDGGSGDLLREIIGHQQEVAGRVDDRRTGTRSAGRTGSAAERQSAVAGDVENRDRVGAGIDCVEKLLRREQSQAGGRSIFRWRRLRYLGDGAGGADDVQQKHGARRGEGYVGILVRRRRFEAAVAAGKGKSSQNNDNDHQQGHKNPGKTTLTCPYGTRRP